MKYAVQYTSRFKKDYKLLKRRNCDISKMLDVIDLLREGVELPPKYHDHPLHGDYEGHRDCHIEPNWVLIYYRHLTASPTVATMPFAYAHYLKNTHLRMVLEESKMTANDPNVPICTEREKLEEFLLS